MSHLYWLIPITLLVITVAVIVSMVTKNNTGAGTSSKSTIGKKIYVIVGLLLLLIAIIFLVNTIHRWHVEARNEAAQQAAQYAATHPSATPQPTTEALVLEHECLTPCSANIQWAFKIRTEGHPVKIKFQGVSTPIDYPGEGDFEAPSQMRSGETEFVSTDHEHPNIRVQVYKRTTISR